MKCREINLIDYVEGKASVETKMHIESCKECKHESVRLKRFVNVVVPVYAEGKRLDEELDKELKSMDLRKMKGLPKEIAEKVAEIRERSIVTRVKKAVGRGKADMKELVENLLSPSMLAQPASPKDITKSKKTTEVIKKKTAKKITKKIDKN
jgi:hypothetical protein